MAERPTRPDEDVLEHDPVLADHDEDEAGENIVPPGWEKPDA